MGVCPYSARPVVLLLKRLSKYAGVTCFGTGTTQVFLLAQLLSVVIAEGLQDFAATSLMLGILSGFSIGRQYICLEQTSLYWYMKISFSNIFLYQVMSERSCPCF
jgi:hypothetical protein